MKSQQKNINDLIPFLQLFVDEAEDDRIETLLLRKRLNIKIGVYVLIVIILGFSWFGSNELDLSPTVYDILQLAILGSQAFLFSLIGAASSTKYKLEKEYKNTFKKELYSVITSALQQDWSYQNDFYFKIKNLVESDIFSEKIKIKNVDYCIESQFDFFPMEIHKIHIKVSDDEQVSNTSDYKGIFIKINLANTINSRAIVAPRISSKNSHKLNLHQKGYELHNESEVTFNRYFKIYNTQNHDLPEMLTPTLQRQLAHFVLNHKKEVYLSFQKDKLYISIKTDEASILPSLKGDISPKLAAEHFYNELQMTLELLKRMK